MHNCSKTVLLVLVCIHLDWCYAVPTFCNEYVHIKVHVPKEISHEHIYHDPLHFHPPPHKVIHHYHHRRRRPSKKGQLLQQQHLHNEHDALLDSLVLSEMKKPIAGDHLEYLQHADDIANNLLKPKKNINTYTVIEETKHPLDDHSHQHWKKPVVETFKIIDAKPSPKHVDTYRIIESKEPTPYRAHKTHTETIKFIEDAYPPKSHGETLKVIDSYIPSTQIEYEEQTGDSGGYHFARHKPHTKTLKVVETKVPRGHTYGSLEHVTAPHTETIEIIETKVTQPKRLRTHGGNRWQSRPDSSGGYIYEDSHSDTHVESYPPPIDSLLPPKDTYLPPKDSYVSLVDSELATKRPADFHQIRPNSVYEDDYRPSGGDGKYLPPSLSDGGDAVDTYTGIDSYAAEHVQGVGSGGYRYL